MSKFEIGKVVVVNQNHPVYGGHEGWVHEDNGDTVWVYFPLYGHIVFKASDLMLKGGEK